MRILEDQSNRKLNDITILLTKNELLEFIGCAQQLLEKPSADHHHLSSEDHLKEITFCIYDPANAGNFNPRIQKLIRDDE